MPQDYENTILNGALTTGSTSEAQEGVAVDLGTGPVDPSLNLRVLGILTVALASAGTSTVTLKIYADDDHTDVSDGTALGTYTAVEGTTEVGDIVFNHLLDSSLFGGAANRYIGVTANPSAALTAGSMFIAIVKDQQTNDGDWS